MKDCTAMMVYNDEVADYYMEFLEERGLHVPEDISLVSFDDAELQDSSTSIQLVTAVHQSISSDVSQQNIFCG